MILDAIIILAMAIVTLLLKILGLITFVIPAKVSETIIYFLGYLGYVKGFFDLATFFLVIQAYLAFLVALYTWKIVKWIYAHLPWFGKYEDLPTLQSGSTEEIGRRLYGKKVAKK